MYFSIKRIERFINKRKPRGMIFVGKKMAASFILSKNAWDIKELCYHIGIITLIINHHFHSIYSKEVT